MTSLISSLFVGAALLWSPQPPQKASILDSLKPFEGHWKGAYAMGSIKMDVDLTWRPFAGKWVDVSYVYSTPKMSLEYRVMLAANGDNSGFNLWMFGADSSSPDPMTGHMEGKTLVVVHSRENEPDVKFWIDDKKNFVMSVLSSAEKNSEIAHAVLVRAKD